MGIGITEIANSREAHGDRVLDMWGLECLSDIQMNIYSKPSKSATQ